MTEVFTASNGVEVWKTRQGDLAVDVRGNSERYNYADALKEYFQSKRDQELGRWRWPENPDYVVKPRTQKIKGRRVVRVFRESTGNVNDIREVEPIRRIDDSLNAAHAYFAAHPEPKPWHDARPGDTWVITTTLHRGEFAVIATTECELQSANGFCYSPTDTTILSGRRIWERS